MGDLVGTTPLILYANRDPVLKTDKNTTPLVTDGELNAKPEVPV